MAGARTRATSRTVRSCAEPSGADLARAGPSRGNGSTAPTPSTRWSPAIGASPGVTPPPTISSSTPPTPPVRSSPGGESPPTPAWALVTFRNSTSTSKARTAGSSAPADRRPGSGASASGRSWGRARNSSSRAVPWRQASRNSRRRAVGSSRSSTTPGPCLPACAGLSNDSWFSPPHARHRSTLAPRRGRSRHGGEHWRLPRTPRLES